MDELGADAQSAEGIRRLIENKSFAALGDALEPFKGKPAAKALSAMPNLFGGIEVLDEVESLTRQRARARRDRLSAPTVSGTG